MGKEKLVNIALIIASVVFTLFVVEIGLRTYKSASIYHFGRMAWDYQFINYRKDNFRRPPPFGSGTASMAPAEFDTRLGWIPRQGVWGPHVTILEDGIRSHGGGEIPSETGAILAVGDSFTFGSQVSDWETSPA
jgi:hypothetical protein